MPEERPSPPPPIGGSGASKPAPVSATTIDVGTLISDAIKAAERLGQPELIEIKDPLTGATLPAVRNREGVDIVDPAAFDAWRPNPLRRVGTATVTRLDSLIDHAKRFKDADSALFANDDRAAPSLTAVLNYHPAGTDEETAPRWGDHRAVYRFPLSPEWLAWTRIDSTWMTIPETAAFVEKHIVDIDHIEPDAVGELGDDIGRLINATGYNNIATPSRLLELSRGLVIHEKSTVGEIRNLQSGEAQILFQSEHTDAAGAPLKVPSLFVICIRPFNNGAYARIAVRLRYNKAPGGLRFAFELWRPDIVFDRAFADAVNRAAEETGLPLFFGTPE